MLRGMELRIQQKLSQTHQCDSCEQLNNPRCCLHRIRTLIKDSHHIVERECQCPKLDRGLQFQMQPFSGCTKCYIHVGFHQDYHLNQKLINQHLDLLVKSYIVNKIVVTGHSLGAALASINALYIAMSGTLIPVQVYNFGSPRFANEPLAKFVKQKIPEHYRLVHYKDLVPHVPPSIQYKHAAYEIFFNKQMTSHQVCSQTGEDPTCSNKFYPNYSVGDHDFYFTNIGDTKC